MGCLALCLAIPAPAQSDSAPSPAATPPPLPTRSSPVAFFRRLLTLTAIERDAELANRPAELQARIAAKLEEYENLAPEERELRLRATELRYYLLPLLRGATTNRAAQLALIPAEHRGLIEDRLLQWDLLPPPLREELLANEAAVRFFTRIHPATPPEPAELLGGVPAEQRPQLQADLERWQALSPEQQETILRRFHTFFELTPAEQAQTLNTLSDEERRAMERTLKDFDRLPATQRVQCMAAFEQFAGLSAAERAQFLRNAERWRNMSPSERQQWRDLVRQLSEMPPLPPGVEPILPHALPPLPPGAGGTAASSPP
jgi:hypothetical protein